MQALAGSQAKEPASKTARVEVVGFFMHEYFTADFKGKDKPRGFGRGLAAEKIIGLLALFCMLCSVKLTSLHLKDDGRHERCNLSELLQDYAGRGRTMSTFL